jgi:phosphoglucomutase
MSLSPRAGKPAEPSMLVNVPQLMTAYYTHRPDPAVPEQGVVFGTSGHRGPALEHTFNEAHILAMSQAICLYRQREQIDGPLFLGIDPHTLSESAFASALEVLAANGVEIRSGPAGRRRRALLGAHSRPVQAAADSRQRRRRSDVPLHDPRLGWEDLL